MLANFSFEMEGSCGTPPCFLMGLCDFSCFGASWPTLGGMWAPFWRAWGSIWEVFRTLFLFIFQVFGTQFFNNVSSMFQPFGHRLDGLVELREACRIRRPAACGLLVQGVRVKRGCCKCKCNVNVNLTAKRSVA